MRIDNDLTEKSLAHAARSVFDHAAVKIRAMDVRWESSAGAPVYTVEGRYTSRGWTEWTQGFQFGAPLLVFDATGDASLLEMGRSRTLTQPSTLRLRRASRRSE